MRCVKQCHLSYFPNYIFLFYRFTDIESVENNASCDLYLFSFIYLFELISFEFEWSNSFNMISFSILRNTALQSNCISFVCVLSTMKLNRLNVVSFTENDTSIYDSFFFFLSISIESNSQSYQWSSQSHMSRIWYYIYWLSEQWDCVDVRVYWFSKNVQFEIFYSSSVSIPWCDMLSRFYYLESLNIYIYVCIKCLSVCEVSVLV